MREDGDKMKITPNAPLFRDPIYDGAADPTIIWNPKEKAWWIFYTNRRASATNIGFSYIHGCDIGIASSSDGGKTWIYRGIVEGLNYEPGRNTYWAPEIVEDNGGVHMFVSYVRGIPFDWNCDRKILHYTSKDLWHWNYEETLKLTSDRVIDACVYKMPDGRWKMWYKDENNDSFSYTAYSDNLYNWKPAGAEITDCPHEGPNVFRFMDKYWMITDPWHGLGVYKSDDACNWTRCSNILKEPGKRFDDGTIGAHADVLVNNGRAYIFYFTHPEVSETERNDPDFVWEYRHRRTSLQVAELKYAGGELVCDRNMVEMDLCEPK